MLMLIDRGFKPWLVNIIAINIAKLRGSREFDPLQGHTFSHFGFSCFVQLAGWMNE